MTPEISLFAIIMCALVCLVASTIVGFSGFGFALIAVPLFTLILNPKFIVPVEGMLAAFCVIVLSANKLRFFKEPAIIFILLGTIPGVALGANLLANFDATILKRILGVVVILFALNIFFRERESRRVSVNRHTGHWIGKLVAFIVGLLSGIAGGMFGTSGPPLVIYVDHFAEDKTAFRAQLIVLFVLNNFFRISMYIYYSLLHVPQIKFALWMLPAVCVGLFAGSKMHFQVNEKTFGRAVAVMLLVSGVLLWIR